MTENQVWINLSSQEFQSKKYPNDGHTTGFFKIATGLWFSLPVNSRYVTKWGEYSKDDSNLQDKFKKLDSQI